MQQSQNETAAAEPAIAIIGGTGPQGRGLALRFALAGLTVAVGSRQAERGQAIAAELNAEIQRLAPASHVPIQGGANGEVVAAAELVFLTVPFEHAATTLEGLREHFAPGAALVDVTVPLAFGKGDVQVVVPPEGSGSRQLRAVLPEAVPLLGACKTLPAHLLEAAAEPLDCDTFVFGDNREAKLRLMETLARIPALRPLDVGGLSAAATLEGMTALLIRLNRRYKSRHGRFGVRGLD